MENYLKLWSLNGSLADLSSLPFIASQGIWIETNASCFEDKFIIPMQCAYQSFGMLNYFLHDKVHINIFQVVEEEIDFSIPWDYFDVTTQEDP